MSKIEVNTVEPQCGTTLTLGGSGDTVSLPSGVKLSGVGTVSWQTTKKTTGFTAVSGEGYFCDTSGGAFTLTLPSSPSAGDIVGFKDYSGNFATNNLTIGRGGSPINGGNTADPVISTTGASIFLVYVDGTQGWVATQDDSSVFSGQDFIVATGGTITCCGNDKIHTFTGPGTFTVCSVASCAANNLVSYMVVAGGGAGGRGASDSGAGGGGGGAGGFRELKSPSTPYTASPLDGYPTPGNRITVTATGFPITVGGGGSAASLGPFNTATPAESGNGNPSTFSTITSTAGGGGGNRSVPTPQGGASGGSGGGGRACFSGGSGNTPPVTPAQGTNGGDGNPAGGKNGGGGGATVAGTTGTPTAHGPGGAGATTSITGSPTAYAGGGGAGGSSGTPAGGTGGTGGGGAGSDDDSANAVAGTANTGGGGGAGAGSCPGSVGKNGGSGIVVIRYRYQ